ncbi:MAG: hypothetical protein FJ011_02370 [Chloroflexi bacterium]|nr:hypothetical protein [Chloroflexota bacterium]
MRLVASLAQLNEIDLAVDAAKARLAEIAAELREPADLVSARRSLAQAERDLARCQAAQREQTGVQQRLADRLAQAERRLYSGQVLDPRELENSEKDVQQIRRQFSQAEDELLEAMIGYEEATAAVTERRATLTRLAAAWEATQTELRGEQARLTKRLAIETPRQTTARRTVPPNLLAVYDALRPRRAGRAVAELDGDTCGVCLVAVPPSLLQAVRDGDELVYCDNCGRILYLGE